MEFSRKNSGKGFSLVELLVVVMIILVIAAIAVPTFLHARMKANEASAASSMKAIQASEAAYNSAYPAVGYSGSLINLGRHGSTCESPGPTNACLIMDDALASGIKDGYLFEVVSDGNTPALSYIATAVPVSPGVSGGCGFSGTASGQLTTGSTSGGSSSSGGRSAFGSGGSAGCE